MLLNNKSLKQRILSGGIWSFSTKLVSGLLTVGITGIVARILPPNELGVFFLSFSMVMFAAVLGRAGVDQACIRLVTEALIQKNTAKAKKIIIDFLSFVLIVAVIVSLTYYFVVGNWVAVKIFSSQSMSNYTLYIAIWMILLTMQYALAEIFRSYHKINFASVFSSGTIYGGFFSGILTTLMLIFAWLSGVDLLLKDIFVLILIAITVGNIFALSIIFKHFYNIKAAKESNIRALLKIGLPLLVTAISFLMLSQADVWILGAYRPEEEVALYSAAQRLTKIIAMTLIVVNEVVSPIIAELNAKKQYSKIQKILQTLAFVATVPALVLLFIFMVFGQEVMSIVYGEYYISAAVLLITLSMGQLIVAFSGSCGLTLSMTGHQNWVMYSSIVTGVLAVLGCFLVVKDYGAEGLAIVMATSLAMQKVVMLIIVKHKYNIWTFARLRI